MTFPEKAWQRVRRVSVRLADRTREVRYAAKSPHQAGNDHVERGEQAGLGSQSTLYYCWGVATKRR
jgi:hypothetical protein